MLVVPPPKERRRWSARLIAEEMKKKEGVEGINRESAMLILKNDTKPWNRRMWCIRTMDREYSKRIYDVIDLCIKKNRQLNVIAVNKKPNQIVSNNRKTMPMKSGSIERDEKT